MLVLFRLLFTGAFIWLIGQLSRSGYGSVETDLNSAGWFALAVIVGIAAACTWAPVIGNAVAGPVAGMMTDGSTYESKDKNLRWIYWALRRGHRRLALGLCFLKGVWEPQQPAAFILGMDNARAGSWCEKLYAREVWRFNNTANCQRAYDIMRYRHGFIPPDHEQSTVGISIQARLQEPKPATPLLPAPRPAPTPKLGRRQRIRLFSAADKPRNPAEQK